MHTRTQDMPRKVSTARKGLVLVKLSITLWARRSHWWAEKEIVGFVACYTVVGLVMCTPIPEEGECNRRRMITTNKLERCQFHLRDD
jgi:hypothetical protein